MTACGWCGGEVRGKRRDARFCSENCRKRACDDKHRSYCVDCGTQLWASSGWRGVARCQSCQAAVRAGGQTVRRRAIQLMWQDGYKMVEIAATLEITKTALGVEMARMRNDGWELPYRYDHKPGAIEKARQRGAERLAA